MRLLRDQEREKRRGGTVRNYRQYFNRGGERETETRREGARANRRTSYPPGPSLTDLFVNYSGQTVSSSHHHHHHHHHHHERHHRIISHRLTLTRSGLAKGCARRVSRPLPSSSCIPPSNARAFSRHVSAYIEYSVVGGVVGLNDRSIYGSVHAKEKKTSAVYIVYRTKVTERRHGTAWHT